MKKWLLGSIVGAILIFLWQFLSWGLIELHAKEFKYTPEQTQLMNSISSALKEDGQYMLPTAAPGASREEKEKLMQGMDGKPYALIIYKSSFKMSMAMPMIRGFLVDVVVCLLLIYILGKMSNLTTGRAWISTLAIGFIGWLWHPYTQHIWFQTPTEVITGALIDWLVAYSLVGIWLGFWLRRS